MAARRFTVRDAIAVAGLTVVFGGLAGAVVEDSRETDHRIVCASNLKQIGMAIRLYANENRGAYPRTTYNAAKPPVWGTPYGPDNAKAVRTDKADAFVGGKDAAPEALAVKPSENDVTAGLYLLLRTEDITPDLFTCPSASLMPFDFGGRDEPLDWTNFPGKDGVAKHLSYSYQNAYPSAKAISAGFKLNNAISPEFAVMADMNPGGEGVLKLTPKSNKEDVRKANSLNHNGVGQNVLFGDGHVLFAQTPLVGSLKDNIYLANDAVDSLKREGPPKIVDSPADADDSILLPTAADVGQVIEAPEQAPITPIADPASVTTKISGVYDIDADGAPGTLTIDATTFTMAVGGRQKVMTYRVLGMRGDVTVLEITQTGRPPEQASFIIQAESLEPLDTGRKVVWKRHAAN